jgi:2OG-Fe(II) oxygenase superfamily
MGWHSDDEKSLGKNNTIASLSLGAERKFLFKHKRVLNTILYNRKEETKDEVRKRKGNIPTAAPSTAITSEPSISNNVSAVSCNDPLFDRKIELVTEGLDPFFGSKLREYLLRLHSIHYYKFHFSSIFLISNKDYYNQGFMFANQTLIVTLSNSIIYY